MMQEKVTSIVQWIGKFGTRIGRIFSAMANTKSKIKKPSESEIAKHTLLRVMRDWSEDAYSAGWMTGLEITIWGLVQKWKKGDPKVGELDAAMFDYLHEKAKGWWVWDEEAEHPVFIPKKTWISMYKELEKALKEQANDASA
jgi:hypothetical protein